MAIGAPVTMGNTTSGTDGTSFNLTTSTNNGPSGSKAFLVTGGFASTGGTAPSFSASGGPGGWTKRKEVTSTSFVAGLAAGVAIFDVDLSSQLNTGTTLTITSSITMFGINMSAFYVTGLGAEDTGVVDGRVKSSIGSAYDTQASSAPSTSVADTILISIGLADDGSTSFTITAPAVEHELFYNPAESWTHVTCYDIKSSIATARIQGTWGSSPPDISALAAYKGASSIATVTPFRPRRMPLGV